MTSTRLASLGTVVALLACGSAGAVSIPIPREAGLSSPADRSNDRFGASVAVGADYALVGAPWDDSLVGQQPYDDTGVAYLYKREGPGWRVAAELTPPFASRRTQFGTSVAIEDRVAVVGAPSIGNLRGDRPDNPRGYAYVYELDPSGQVADSTWLQPSGLSDFSRFGESVAASRDTVVVSASRQQNDGSDVLGKVWVFQSNGVQFLQQPAAEFAASASSTNTVFGLKVGIANGQVVVASDTTVGFYSEGDAGWGLDQEVPWSVVNFNSMDMDADGDTVVVSDPFAAGTGDLRGAAYVYERSDGGDWTRTTTLTPHTGVLNRFGSSVAVSGDSILVGDFADDEAENNAGAVFHYRRDAVGDWVPSGKFIVEGSDDFTNLGFDVALWDDTALAGANRAVDPSRITTGSAYLFRVPEPAAGATLIGLLVSLAAVSPSRSLTG